MKHPTPNPAGTSAPHWQAAGDAQLALPCCASCRRFHWPARMHCPRCRGETTWRPASGFGRIAAFSIVRRAVNPELAEDAPYAVAFVELDEGVRLFTNIVDATPDTLEIGMRVRCRFEAALDAGVHVPVFAPHADIPQPSAAVLSGRESGAGSP